VLDNEVKEAEQRTKVHIEGKVATGQCDGWKNTAKKSVVTSMMIVENEVSNYLLIGEIQCLPKLGIFGGFS
jgi:hypothetical protein